MPRATDITALSEYRDAPAWADAQIAASRDDPAARLALMERLFRGPTGRAPRHLPFRRAALSFMRWQAQRGLLNPLDAAAPGSVWWRAMNERLLRHGCEAIALVGGSVEIRHRRLSGCGCNSPTRRHRLVGTALTTQASWPATWSTKNVPKRKTFPSASS
jgi:hypothetical protein